MLLKLTNAAKGRVGEGLILNTDTIISMFDHTQEDGTKVSAAYSTSGNSWEVVETIDQIYSMIEGDV
jgi:hypothetical protein